MSDRKDREPDAFDRVMDEYLDTRDYEAAIAGLLRVARLARARNDRDLLTLSVQQLGFLNHMIGRPEAALRHFLRLTVVDPRYRPAWRWAVRMACDLGRPRKALAIADRARAEWGRARKPWDRSEVAALDFEAALAARLMADYPAAVRWLRRHLRHPTRVIGDARAEQYAQLLLEEALLAAGEGNAKRLARLARRELRTAKTSATAAAALAVACSAMGQAAESEAWRSKARQWARHSVGHPACAILWQLTFAILRRLRTPVRVQRDKPVRAQ